MKNIKIIIIVLFTGTVHKSLFCQTEKNSFYILAGLAKSEADKEYKFLEGRVGSDIIESVKKDLSMTSLDKEIYININYKYSLSNKLSTNFGFGYSKVVNYFKLPANGFHYNFNFTIFLFNEKYSKHQIQIPLGFKYYIINNKNLKIEFGVDNFCNFSFRKTAKMVDYLELNLNRLNFS